MGDIDRISQLPECIGHRILSCFDTLYDPPLHLVRMSVLSKTWFHLTASFPILEFRIHSFSSRESFFKYLEYTTARFCHQNVTAHALHLVTTLDQPAELDVVNTCLESLLNRGVNELVIYIEPAASMPKYRLPNTLLSVSVLKSLTLFLCELPSSLMVDGAKYFKSLTRLELEKVHMDEEVIECLTASCPLLQDFHVNKCRGFKKFCVYGHRNLREVWIYYDTPVEVIDIEAKNLSTLLVADMNGTHERGAPRMNLVSCEKLTTVSYFGYPLPNSNGFTDFLSHFPFIETLYLTTKYKCSNLKLSSQSLRTLVVHSKCDLGKIEFSTPNLVLFSYSCDVSVEPPEVWDSTTLLKACMRCYPNGEIITALWFHNLRLFLDKKSGFKALNLYIDATNCGNFIKVEHLNAIELQPYELEHVELQLNTNEDSSDHVAFVDALLWCFRPQSLTISFADDDFEVESEFVKFTYEKLLEQEVKGHTDIQIVSPSSKQLMSRRKSNYLHKERRNR